MGVITWRRPSLLTLVEEEEYRYIYPSKVSMSAFNMQI